MTRIATTFARFAIVATAIMSAATMASGQSPNYAAISGAAIAPDGTPLPAVWITLSGGLQNSTNFTVTAPAGNYFIQGLAPGDYTLTAELAGFATHIGEVTLNVGQTTTANIKMSLQ